MILKYGVHTFTTKKYKMLTQELKGSIYESLVATIYLRHIVRSVTITI